MILIILRHGARADKQGKGSTVAWRERCPTGHEYDPPLTPAGQCEALAAGEELRRLRGVLGFEVAAVVSSPFLRCLETAIIAASALRGSLGESGSSERGEEGDTGPLQIKIAPWLSEWLGEDLFPTKPQHLLSPIADTLLHTACCAAPFGAAGAPRWVFELPATAAPEREVLEAHPETKAAANARVLRGLDALLASVSLPPPPPPPPPSSASTRATRPAIVLVTHQYCCHALVSQLLTRGHAATAQHAPADAARGGPSSGVGAGTAPMTKRQQQRFNWKHEAVAAARTAASQNPGLLMFGKSPSDLLDLPLPVDFATASVTILEVEASGAGSGIPVVHVLSQAPPVRNNTES